MIIRDWDLEVLELFLKHNFCINYIARSTGVSSSFEHTKHEILATSYKTDKSNIGIKNNHYIQLDMFAK